MFYRFPLDYGRLAGTAQQSGKTVPEATYVEACDTQEGHVTKSSRDCVYIYWRARLMTGAATLPVTIRKLLVKLSRPHAKKVIAIVSM